MHFGGHSAAVFITRSAATLLAKSPIGVRMVYDTKQGVEAGVVEMLLTCLFTPEATKTQ